MVSLPLFLGIFDPVGIAECSRCDGLFTLVSHCSVVDRGVASAVVINPTLNPPWDPTRCNSVLARLFVQVGGQQVVEMLSLDEPLDLKLPRRPSGRDRGACLPALSPLHPKQSRQLLMADDGTAVIEPASPDSPRTGE